MPIPVQSCIDRPQPSERSLTTHWRLRLHASCFATRIAASTGASLPTCLLAGLATLSGPMHGDTSGRVQALFGDVERLGEDQVAGHYLSAGLPFAGFGHPLYPDGDPRAAALLSLFDPPEVIARFIRKVTALTGLHPTSTSPWRP